MSLRRIDIGGLSWWPDVCADVFAYAVDRVVFAVRMLADRSLETLWSFRADEPVMFNRVGVNEQTGEAVVVGKGHDTGAALLIRASGVTVIGTTYGNAPLAIGLVNGLLVIRWVETKTTIATLHLATGERRSDPIPAELVGTSQGIRDLALDGSIIYADQRRAITVGAWTLAKPVLRNGVIVGQASSAPKIVVATADRVFTALQLRQDELGEDPRLSILPAGRLLVSAYTDEGASLAIIDPPYPDPEPPPVDVPVIGRPCWLGWFVFGAMPDLPATCSLPVDADMLVRNRAGAIVAQYVAAPSDGDVAALDVLCAQKRQQRPGIPVLGYWTRQAQSGAVPQACDHLGIESYRGVDETLDACERRIRGGIARAGTRPVWLVAQTYTSNAAQTTDLLSLVPMYARLARECPSVLGILCFSAGSRATGYDEHPEIHPAYVALAAGIPGTPPLPAPVPSPKPTPTPAPKPVPVPAPAPAPVPSTPFPAASPLKGSAMKVYLKKAGKYVGVQPGTTQVYADRAAGGDWESVELEPQGDRFRATFTASGLVLSIQPDGALETRRGGTAGGYELVNATSQPQPDPVNLLYRVLDDGTPVGLLTIEEVQS